MNLHPDDGRLFYKLFSALLGYVNRKLEVIPGQFALQTANAPPGRRADGKPEHTITMKARGDNDLAR
jgi:hypothetical protein